MLVWKREELSKEACGIIGGMKWVLRSLEGASASKRDDRGFHVGETALIMGRNKFSGSAVCGTCCSTSWPRRRW